MFLDHAQLTLLGNDYLIWHPLSGRSSVLKVTQSAEVAVRLNCLSSLALSRRGQGQETEKLPLKPKMLGKGVPSD